MNPEHLIICCIIFFAASVFGWLFFLAELGNRKMGDKLIQAQREEGAAREKYVEALRCQNARLIQQIARMKGEVKTVEQAMQDFDLGKGSN